MCDVQELYQHQLSGSSTEVARSVKRIASHLGKLSWVQEAKVLYMNLNFLLVKFYYYN